MAKSYQAQITKQVKRDRQQAAEKQLASSNNSQLAVYEAVIEEGVKASIAVGGALKTIKDEGLWKSGYKTFSAYIESRWTFGVRYANYMISAARVVDVVGVEGGPKNAGTAREFAALCESDPEKAQAEWAALTSHYPNPTAAQARAFIRDPKPAAPPKPMEEHARQTTRFITITLDKHFPETGMRGRAGWRGSRSRKEYLMAINKYLQEQIYLAHGLYRGKQKHLRPFEEPSAESPDGRVYDAKDPEPHQGIVTRSKLTDEYTPPKKPVQ